MWPLRLPGLGPERRVAGVPLGLPGVRGSLELPGRWAKPHHLPGVGAAGRPKARLWKSAGHGPPSVGAGLPGKGEAAIAVSALGPVEGRPTHAISVREDPPPKDSWLCLRMGSAKD